MNKYKGYSKMWFLVLILVAFVAGCASNAQEIADTIAPTVSFTSPTNTAEAVPINRRKVNVAFSEAMDPATITTATFTLKQGTTPVSGTVTYVGTTATFTLASNLVNSVLCTATITTGVKDLAGNALATDFVFTFTTGAAADTIAPTVSVTSPTNTAVAVPINRKVNIGFSEVMDPATITTASFTVKETVSGNNVQGTVTSVGTSATFTPTSNLAAGTEYTATITTGVKDLAGNALVTDFVFTFTTGAAADTIAPTVSFTSPADGSIAVALNRKVNVAFSEFMDPLTITTATFKMTGPGLTPVTGTVSYIGTTATFTPLSDLAANTIFTGTITTGAKDLAGNAVATNYVWTFTTGMVADTTAPTVISTIPLDLATGVATNSVVTATFSEAMDPLTIAAVTFTVKETVSGNNVLGTVIYADGSKTATFTPLSNLAFSTNYTATIKGGIGGVTDLAGNAMAVDKVWSFTTGAAPDTIAPTVTITNPVDLATGVAINSSINATFSEAMDPLTISTATFTVQASGPPLGTILAGTVAYDPLNNIATFTPLSNLASSTTYTATVTTGTTDLAGNALVAGLVPNPWTFTTAAESVPVVPLAINLRGAASFGIASRAGLTSTGVTVVNGDVALHPLATCTDATGNAGASQTCLVKTYASPTGMTVNGSIYWAGDPFDSGVTANSVTNDLNVAWTEGQNKVDTRGAIAADEMGGKTFIPGVYHNAALGLMAGGIAMLDAQNDANAIFIFKVDSSFVDSGTLLLPSEIRLINGAQARNVWFVTGLDITIGSGTTWNGNILAGRTATILDGSTVNGRVLGGASGAGAITLTGAASPSVTTITVPQ